MRTVKIEGTSIFPKLCVVVVGLFVPVMTEVVEENTSVEDGKIEEEGTIIEEEESIGEGVTVEEGMLVDWIVEGICVEEGTNKEDEGITVDVEVA